MRPRAPCAPLSAAGSQTSLVPATVSDLHSFMLPIRDKTSSINTSIRFFLWWEVGTRRWPPHCRPGRPARSHNVLPVATEGKIKAGPRANLDLGGATEGIFPSIPPIVPSLVRDGVSHFLPIETLDGLPTPRKGNGGALNGQPPQKYIPRSRGKEKVVP